MDWVEAKLIGSDINKHKCWITEVVEIRKRANGYRQYALAHLIVLRQRTLALDFN